jgi:hypothetical protein
MIFGATSTDMHLFHKALGQWGLQTQIYKTFEEIAELKNGAPGQNIGSRD